MTVLSVKWKKVEEPLLIQVRKTSFLNGYRNKCNWISLTELVLSLNWDKTLNWVLWELRDYQQTEIKASSWCTITSFLMGTGWTPQLKTIAKTQGTLAVGQQVTSALSVPLLCCCDSQPLPVPPREQGHKPGEFTSLLTGGQGRQNLQSWNQSRAGMDTLRGENKRRSTCTGTAQNGSCNLKVAPAQTVCRVLIWKSGFYSCHSLAVNLKHPNW